MDIPGSVFGIWDWVHKNVRDDYVHTYIHPGGSHLVTEYLLSGPLSNGHTQWEQQTSTFRGNIPNFNETNKEGGGGEGKSTAILEHLQ